MFIVDIQYCQLLYFSRILFLFFGLLSSTSEITQKVQPRTWERNRKKKNKTENFFDTTNNFFSVTL